MNQDSPFVSAGVRLCVGLVVALGAGCTGSIDSSDLGAGPEEGQGSPAVGNGRSPGATTGSNTPAGNPSGGSTPAVMPPSSIGGMVSPGLPPPDVAAGPAPLRRLTALQYTNTVRDLLRLPAPPVVNLSSDEGEAGYAANASVTVKDLQVEEYGDAAAQIVKAAIADLGALVPCAQNPGGAEAACAQELITQFGRRAFRRPLETAEVERYRDLYGRLRTGSTFADAAGGIIEAMLQSPHFLYRLEIGTGTADASGSVALNPYEVASRLSYFLWSSMPDDALFAAAEDGTLRTPEGVAAQAKRLIEHANARASIVSFHEQWLHLEELVRLEKDKKAFPSFTPELRKAMHEEVQRFVDHVIRQGDGRLETLLTAGASHLTGPLFAHYGLPAPKSKEWQPTMFPAGQRAGILSLAGVMATHAHAAQSSLVARGVLIRENLLCTKLPTPPPGVDDNPPAVSSTATARQRFAAHRKDPACGGCHALIDSLGEPFEVYDGIGRYRTMEGASPVDSTGMLTGTMDSDGPVKDPAELVAKLAGSEDVRQCMMRQWFRFAFGREEADADLPALSHAYDTFKRSDYKVKDLLVALATSKLFTHRNAVRPQ